VSRFALPFRAEDQKLFEALRNGLKTIETRAGSPRYAKIQSGDTLVFICAGQKFERKVRAVEYFATPAELFKKYSFQKVMPFAESLEDAVASYDLFPGYKERIRRYGILAFI
jgi:ASC-1-like (ASCH) protein